MYFQDYNLVVLSFYGGSVDDEKLEDVYNIRFIVLRVDLLGSIYCGW